MGKHNFYLKSIFVLTDGTMTAAAKAVGMRLDRLSQVIHGHVNATVFEKDRISNHLQRPISELF